MVSVQGMVVVVAGMVSVQGMVVVVVVTGMVSVQGMVVVVVAGMVSVQGMVVVVVAGDMVYDPWVRVFSPAANAPHYIKLLPPTSLPQSDRHKYQPTPNSSSFTLHTLLSLRLPVPPCNLSRRGIYEDWS
ncbi:hypothetical protein Pcinc_000889 [Petrolisthes cinctipes]|uniref:Uncharacterized protein n=1 Tax=Petrolisthes cinctipes TaxID=88211 RepID=A0AAE1GM10_PETCI|nr:hypothetical protein Pcinc_000889 [Petrolisthes cinctipes]